MSKLDYKNNNLILTHNINYGKIAAGCHFTIFICDDGTIKWCGVNTYGQCDIPDDHYYTMCAVGFKHSILIDDSGIAYAFGNNNYGQLDIQKLENKQQYIMCAASVYVSILLRNDNIVIITGLHNDKLKIKINTYTDLIFEKKIINISVNTGSYLFLFNDGTVMGFHTTNIYNSDVNIIGINIIDIIIPILSAGIIYISCATYNNNTILLDSNNKIHLIGKNMNYDIIYQDNDVYISCYIGRTHILLLTKTGLINIFKNKEYSYPNYQNIFLKDKKYIFCSNSNTHAVVLSSDGNVTMISIPLYCDVILYEIPTLDYGQHYGNYKNIIYNIFISSYNEESITFNFYNAISGREYNLDNKFNIAINIPFTSKDYFFDIINEKLIIKTDIGYPKILYNSIHINSNKIINDNIKYLFDYIN